MNIHLKLLLVFLQAVNFCFSPIGYRLLHSANALAFGVYKFGTKFWFLIYFLLYAIVLEAMVTPHLFNPKEQHRIGCEIINELKQEIKRRKKKKDG